MAERAGTEQPDRIGGDLTTELAGLTLEYSYSTGNRYLLTFGPDVLEFVHLNGPEPQTRIPLRYRARRLHDGQYLVGWVVKEAAIHVALVVDVAAGRVDVSGLMPGGWEFFDTARVHSVVRS